MASQASTTDETTLEPHPLSPHLPPDILTDLLKSARAKARSTETHDNVHIPDLRSVSGEISCLLLGDSMLERFKTTGRSTHFGPEPNATRLDTSSSLPVTHADDGAEIASGTSTSAGPLVQTLATGFIDPSLIPSYNPMTKTFNAGVGGDSLRNIIYRLTGTPTNPGGLLYALQSLASERQPRYIFLLAGTNDLGDGRKPLSTASLSQYRLIIKALTHVLPQARIWVCGLMPKAKVKQTSVIDDSNLLLKTLVEDMNKANTDTRVNVKFLPTDGQLALEHLEDDGVHLNADGYEILGRSMFAKLEEMVHVISAGKKA